LVEQGITPSNAVIAEKVGIAVACELFALHFLLLDFTEARHHSLSYLRWVTATFSHLGHHVPHHPRHHLRHHPGNSPGGKSHGESTRKRTENGGK
jgi:hypothetical protein